MIVVESRKLVLITPPKCGSTTLRRELCVHTGVGHYIDGPQPDGSIDAHTVILPDYCKRGYRRILITRHPHDRLVSQWLHYVRTSAKWGHGACSFVDFANAAAAGEESPPSCTFWPSPKFPTWFYFWTVSRFALPITIDQHWRIEELADHLFDDLKIEPHGLHENKSERVDVDEYYSPQLAEAVDKYVAPDLLKFAYGARPWHGKRDHATLPRGR